MAYRREDQIHELEEGRTELGRAELWWARSTERGASVRGRDDEEGEQKCGDTAMVTWQTQYPILPSP